MSFDFDIFLSCSSGYLFASMEKMQHISQMLELGPQTNGIRKNIFLLKFFWFLKERVSQMDKEGQYLYRCESTNKHYITIFTILYDFFSI